MENFNSKSNASSEATSRYANILLENKIEAFQSETKTRQTVLLTMVTTFGVKANAYFRPIFC